jgi:hypothetical protein
MDLLGAGYIGLFVVWFYWFCWFVGFIGFDRFDRLGTGGAIPIFVFFVSWPPARRGLRGGDEYVAC